MRGSPAGTAPCLPACTAPSLTPATCHLPSGSVRVHISLLPAASTPDKAQAGLHPIACSATPHVDPQLSRRLLRPGRTCEMAA